MSELKVELSQIDKTDLTSVRNIVTSGFSKFLDESCDFLGMNFNSWFESIVGSDKHTFAIRVSKSDANIAERSWLVGVCGITEIDWISRHGKIVFIMVDKDGHKCTLQNHPASLQAFKKVLKYAFEELCLNKVWMSTLSNNDIRAVLDSHGFVADGIRRQAVFSSGKYMDEYIFSITMKEYLENTL